MKINSIRAELFHADGGTRRADMTNLIVGFRNFMKAPKIVV